MKLRVGATVLLLTAAALAIVEYRAARDATAAEFERVFGPHEYTARAVVTDLIENDNVAAVASKRIRVSASLENAWMNITATVQAADGSALETRPLYIDYFLRPKRGIHWTWGLPMASALVRVPPENYRLQLHVNLAPDGAAAPPLRVQVLPVVTGSRARLLACSVTGVLGLALLLRSFAPARSRPDARGSPPPRDLDRNAGKIPGSGRLHFIDGLRGIAAVSVLVCHLFVPEFFPSVRLIESAVGNRIPELLRTGALGVEVFFVLSGFVIAYSIRRYRVTPGFILRFIGRRFLRLDPPYYAALFLAIVVMAFSMADSLHASLRHFQAGKGLLINALYLQDILGYQSPFGTVAWTLCLEVQFYLALVTLTGVSEWIGRFASAGVRATASRAAWWVLFGSLGVASLVTWESNHNNFTFLATWFRFLLGVLTFRCLNAGASPWPFASLLGALMIAGIGFSDARGFTAAATAGLILAAGHAGALGRWLDGRVWQFLGRLSYSLYLFHVVLAIPLLTFVWSRVPHTLTFAILLVPWGVVVALACAWVMHGLLERPSLALSRRLGYSRRPDPATGTSRDRTRVSRQ